MQYGRRIRLLFRLESIARDVAEEVDFHIDAVRRELMASGLTAAEADRQARARFGDEAAYRRKLERIGRQRNRMRAWDRRVDALSGALRHSLRLLRISPGLSLGVVGAFALGIGANATMFGTLDRLLLRPPEHVREADGLRLVGARGVFRGEEYTGMVRPYPELLDYRQASTLAGIAGYDFGIREQTIGRGEGALRLRTHAVSGNYFAVLGADVALGRAITDDDDVAGAPAVAVLSYGAWQRHYDGARNVLGRTLDFGRGPFTIVGVARRGFTGAELEPVDLWVPLSSHRSELREGRIPSRANHFLKLVARLAPGVDAAAAEAELTVLHRAALQASGRGGTARQSERVAMSSLIPGENPHAGAEVRVAVWLGGVAAVVLLIAALNVANLLLARGLRASRDTGVRLALGVTRGRLLLQVFTDVVVLALLGGVCGLALTRLVAAPLRALLLPGISWDGGGSDGRVLLCALVLSVGAACVAAIVPAVQLLRWDVQSVLRAGSTLGSRAKSLRGALVSAQVMLSVVLLSGAVLFLYSFRAAAREDLGIDTNSAWHLTLVADGLEESAQRQLLARLAEDLASQPGISALAASSTLSFFNRHGLPFRIDGVDSVSADASVHAIAGAYFEALGLEARKGRVLGPGDGAGAAPVAVINETFATRLRGADPIGRCLRIGESGRCTTIVGVVEDARILGIGSEPQAQYYVPAAQQPDAQPLYYLIARTSAADPAAIDALRRRILNADVRVRYVEAEPIGAVLDGQRRPWALGAVLFTGFGGLALVIAVLGLYSVIGFEVARRTRELGLRSALGASPRALLALVLRQSVELWGIGVAAGAALVWWLAPRLEGLLYQVPARDPRTLLIVGALLGAATLAAAAAPARRAAATDPAASLRADT